MWIRLGRRSRHTTEPALLVHVVALAVMVTISTASWALKTDSGKTYDIDHQDDVKKFEGKKVRVQGKLDETGTKIQVK